MGARGSGDGGGGRISYRLSPHPITHRDEIHRSGIKLFKSISNLPNPGSIEMSLKHEIGWDGMHHVGGFAPSWSA